MRRATSINPDRVYISCSLCSSLFVINLLNSVHRTPIIEKDSIKFKTNAMKNLFKIALLTLVVSVVSCASNEDETTDTQQTIFKATIDGQLLDYGNTSNGITAFVEVTLWDNKRLVISGTDFDLNTSLRLTIGETFLEDPIATGLYKIGTLQDHLETNLYYFNSNDTNGNTTASSEYYSGVYGCDVLASNQVGEVNITNLDTENKTISGTFSGTLFRWIDVTTGELKSVELENGMFSLPYIDRTEDENPDKNIISARVDGFRMVTDDPGSPDSRRSQSSGIDKIRIQGYDGNFGRLIISVPSDVQTGNNYVYQPDGSFQSLGISFENRINIPENLLSNNPDQSNDSYISISNHNEDTNVIEGTFYIENSEIEDRTITDGYFKVTYIDEID